MLATFSYNRTPIEKVSTETILSQKRIVYRSWTVNTVVFVKKGEFFSRQVHRSLLFILNKNSNEDKNVLSNIDYASKVLNF